MRPDCSYISRMLYEWDPCKADINLAKHGISFSAATRFDWERAIVRTDDRRDYGERRWIAIAPIEDRVHVLVFTMRASRIRVISLRKANRRECDAWKKIHRP